MQVPTLQQIKIDLENAMTAELGLTFIGKTFLYPFIIVLAGFFRILYAHSASTMKNIFPDTADPEDIGGTLERFGRVMLGRERRSATQGQFSINVTGSGGTVPEGTTFKIPDGDYIYIVDNDTIIPSLVTVRSLNAGTDSDLENGVQLEITQPIAGVDSVALVAATVLDPTDAETYDQYREEILQAFQAEPTGGSGADYRLWASDIAAVRTVFAYVTDGAAGEIDVYVEQVSQESTPYLPEIPSQAILDSLYIENVDGTREGVLVLDPDETKDILDRGRLPVGVFAVNMAAINLIPIDVEITDLNVPGGDDLAVQAAITEAVLSYSYNIRPFVSGADDPNIKTDTMRQTEISAVVQGILTDGQSVGKIELLESAVAISSRLFTFGDVPNVTINFLTS